MRGSIPLARVELGVLLLTLGCRDSRPRPTPVGDGGRAAVQLSQQLLPRPSSRFVCQATECRQNHPRLPSTAEWRCAEQANVVFCAGGEPAAGVVAGPPDPAFRCGKRWSDAEVEEICIDEHPEYPESGASVQCRFEQERSVARVCHTVSQALTGAPLPAGALPACWLDRDCPASHCDRGACTCESDRDCERGRCAAQHCVEASP